MHIYFLIDNGHALFLLTNLHVLKSLNKVTCVDCIGLFYKFSLLFCFPVPYAPRDMPIPFTAFL